VNKTNSSGRVWQIDALRGMSIVMMIIFHAIYDITYFGDTTFDLYPELWWYFARVIASLFLLIVGISLTLSYNRVTDNMSPHDIRKKYIVRGLKIFGWGLLITMITGIFLDKGVILFGILHCIGISIIVAYPLIKYRYINLIIGILCIMSGVYLSRFTFDFNILLWLGFRPHALYSFDYVPLLPWFGLVSLGLFIGNTLFFPETREILLQKKHPSLLWPVKALCFLGRHSLFIYLLHQPILIGILSGFGIISIQIAGFG
jgi:uncharacterized membrane protein